MTLKPPSTPPPEEMEMKLTSDAEAAWIAIGPPASPRPSHKRQLRPASPSRPTSQTDSELPSFESAQFDVVLRRQRMRPKGGGGLKLTALPSRFLNLSNDFEFSGWGTVSRIDLTSDDLADGLQTTQRKRAARTLGQLTASALAGNAVLGSVFYALPAVVAVSGVYSPISLFLACLIIFLWRPVMEELASALPISGAPYTYLLNVSSKTLALFGAALLLLDFAATAIVSAATAMTYLAGEVALPFPVFAGTIIVLALFTFISLSGLRESARITFVILSAHLITMTAITLASIVAWSHSGNAQLRSNWHAGRMTSSTSSSGIARQIFDGVCLGMLGLTGFECIPSYAASIKPGRFPRVLRNLHYPAILSNVLTMLLLLALVPLDTVLAGENVLSVLAQTVGGRWLRIWIVVDAVIVLCGGIITGITGACELLERLAHDRILPNFVLRELSVTQARPFAIFFFSGFSMAVYATSGASLIVVSKMFSLVWLMTMTLFPLSALLLKFNRGRIRRTPRTPLTVVFIAFAIAAVVFSGNIAMDPSTAGYAAGYLVVLVALFCVAQAKGRVAHWAYWACDQSPRLHAFAWTQRLSEGLVGVVRRTRRQPVCVLAKTDEINHLFQEVLYVSRSEETSCLKLVHFCGDDERHGVPSEMEANWKILDEAFPEITIDLILVRAEFSPATVAALAHRLRIPTSLMFMSCPGLHFAHAFSDFGTRIISL